MVSTQVHVDCSSLLLLIQKKVWILEPFTQGTGGWVAFRSHLGRYLAVDQFGNVTCDAEEKDDAAKFEISVADDSSGRWALRNDVRGYYLGARLLLGRRR